MPTKESNLTPPDGDRIALATFALAAAEREERVFALESRSVEVILGGVGFSPAEVQGLTGGNSKTITSRMKKGKAG